MKKYILFIIVLLLSFVSNAQNVLKIRITHSCERHIDNNNWTTWSDWKEASILVVVDGQQERITIYSKIVQTFDILEDEGQTLTDKGEPTLNFFCIDQDGTKCRIRIIKRNESTQIYVDYNNLMLCYNVKKID
jgi:hypothetical protein